MTNTEDKSVKARQDQHEVVAAIVPATETDAEIAADKQHPIADKDNQPGSNPDITATRQTEHGGAKGLEPTRYGDWEHNSRCTDF